MRELGFEPSDADPDIWMRVATKLDGFKYYEYVLIYVDDILALGEHPEKVMISLSEIYRLKKDKKTGKAYAPPERYLGANILASTTFPTVKRHGTFPPTIMLRRQSKWWNRI
eukprot:scaffold190140_cov34-Attheya_sp.AAC.2